MHRRKAAACLLRPRLAGHPEVLQKVVEQVEQVHRCRVAVALVPSGSIGVERVGDEPPTKVRAPVFPA